MHVTLPQRILLASTQLMHRYGIRAVSMDDIAREVGISKKTLYQHFPTKEILVERITEEHFCQEECLIVHLKQQFANPVEQLVQTFLHVNQSIASMFPGLLTEMRRYYPKAYQRFETFKSVQIHQYVLDNLARGQEQGYYRSELNPEVMALLYEQLPGIMMNPEIFPPQKYGLKEVHLQIVFHFLYGLVTAKGLQFIEPLKIDLGYHVV